MAQALDEYVAELKSSELVPLVDNATQNAGNAADSAELAEKWASNPENTVVKDGKYSAFHYAKKAEKAAADAEATVGQGLTPNRVLVSNADGKFTVSDITTEILSYLSGLTGNVQEQLNDKLIKNATVSVLGAVTGNGSFNNGALQLSLKAGQAIQEMLTSGEGLKTFYRFVASNPHIALHDACQIVIERPSASICFSFEEWNAQGRRVTKGRKGIPYYDNDGSKHFVFAVSDTHGDNRYRRSINPVKKILDGLDLVNGTEIAGSNRGDYSIENLREYMLSMGKDYLTPFLRNWTQGASPHNVWLRIRGHSRGERLTAVMYDPVEPRGSAGCPLLALMLLMQ